MSYEPTTWQTGDVVTAEKMNKLEQGVANAGSGGTTGGILCVTIQSSGETETLNKTFREIRTAFDNGTFVFLKGESYLTYIESFDENVYALHCFYVANGTCYSITYTSNSADEYPTSSGS